MRILNIHGFMGSVENTNYKMLRDMYPDAVIVDDYHDYMKDSPEDIICTYCAYEDFDLVIGNSFGGFIAYIIGAISEWKTLLTNPCIPASDYIKDVINDYPFIEELERLWDVYKGDNHNCCIMLGLKDEAISPQKTIDALKGSGANISLSPDSGHLIQGDTLKNWLEQNTHI